LGISALFHDSAAVLLCNGRVVAAANEERFSRVKHDSSLPFQAIRWCLQQAGLTSNDVEHVVYYEKPLRRFERQLVTQVLKFPISFKAFRRSAFNVLTNRLWVGSTLVKELEIDSDRLLFCEHHLSHAASAFYCSPFENAAILTVDGVGEWVTTGLYQADGSGISPLAEIRFPQSIGLVYSAFTAYLGFRVNNGEYKVMGMAPYGEPRFVEQVRKVLRPVPGEGFAVDMDFLSYHYSATDSYNQKFVDLFGPPRFPGSALDPTTGEGRRFADVAASIQKVTEECMVELARELHSRTGLDALCMAGGVALNSVANRHILEQTPFKQVYIQPAAGDAGGALGAALWAWREVMGQPAEQDAVLPSPGMGRSFSDEEIGEILADLRIQHEQLPNDQVADRAAEDIADGLVVAWFQGGFEWGPRALGYRSILADPGRKDMRDRINKKVKFREPFRPFAPSVLAESAGDWFHLPEGGEQPLQWMLMVTPVKEGVGDKLPSVTHVDGSARVHLVTKAANPLYHDLIHCFEKRTGYPVILNTSFNLKGEPIVSSPIHALATFQRSGLDVMYLGSHRIQKENP